MKKILIISTLFFSTLSSRTLESEFEQLDYLKKKLDLAAQLKGFNSSGVGFGAHMKTPEYEKADAIYQKVKNEYEAAIKEYFELDAKTNQK